jgi:hypothetical protein
MMVLFWKQVHLQKEGTAGLVGVFASVEEVHSILGLEREGWFGGVNED